MGRRGKEGGGLVGAHVFTGEKLCVAEQMYRAACLRHHRRETGKTWKRREERREERREGKREGGRTDGEQAAAQKVGRRKRRREKM